MNQTGRPNQHPVVMFEILAQDPGSLRAFYAAVFGWTYDTVDDFSYVEFPVSPLVTLGGIGPASSKPGWWAGCNFYLATDDLEQTLAAVVAQQGSVVVSPTTAGRHRFAMFADPAGNVIGLLQQARGTAAT